MKNATKPLAIISGASLFALVALSSAFVVPASADTATTTVSSAIGSIISLFTTNTTVNINATPSAGGVQTIASDTVTISTNNATGYTLKVAETTGVNTLTSGANTIAASAGTLASPIAMAVNTWGYRVVGAGGFGATATSAVSSAAIGALTFAAVPATATPDTIKTTATTATSDTTTVWYGVAVNTSKPSGTYTNSVTYTATTNP